MSCRVLLILTAEKLIVGMDPVHEGPVPPWPRDNESITLFYGSVVHILALFLCVLVAVYRVFGSHRERGNIPYPGLYSSPFD